MWELAAGMAQVKAGPGLDFDLTRSLLSSHTLGYTI